MNDATRRSTIRFLIGTAISAMGLLLILCDSCTARARALRFGPRCVVLAVVSGSAGRLFYAYYRTVRNNFAAEMERRHSSANDGIWQAMIAVVPLALYIVCFRNPWGGRGLIFDLAFCGLAAWAGLLPVFAVGGWWYRHGFDIHPGDRASIRVSPEFELSAKG